MSSVSFGSIFVLIFTSQLIKKGFSSLQKVAGSLEFSSV